MGRLTEQNTTNTLNKFKCKNLDMTCDNTDCYECKYMHEIMDKLGDYEDICDDTNKLKEISKLYLEKCEEVNKLNAEIEKIKEELEEIGSDR